MSTRARRRHPPSGGRLRASSRVENASALHVSRRPPRAVSQGRGGHSQVPRQNARALHVLVTRWSCGSAGSVLSAVQCPSNAVRHGVGMFVRPRTDHAPVGFGQVFGLSRVPSAVLCELSLPVLRVRGGCSRVLGAPVPPAPVNEHRQALPREDDIGPNRSRQPLNAHGTVYAEAEAAAMKRRAHGELRRGVCAAVGAHDRPSRLGHIRPWRAVHGRSPTDLRSCWP